MQFATQHKQVSIDDGNKKRKYLLHRNKKTVWATQDTKGKSAIVFSHTFKHVSKAKAWMEQPDLRTK